MWRFAVKKKCLIILDSVNFQIYHPDPDPKHLISGSTTLIKTGYTYHTWVYDIKYVKQKLSKSPSGSWRDRAGSIEIIQAVEF
jgi:hypothetical protein